MFRSDYHPFLFCFFFFFFFENFEWEWWRMMKKIIRIPNDINHDIITSYFLPSTPLCTLIFLFSFFFFGFLPFFFFLSPNCCCGNWFVPTPALPLSKNHGNPLSYLIEYCSTIGALQYLCFTCPDIQLVVNKFLSFCITLLMFIGLQ